MRALVTSPNYFAVLGVRPVAGRVFDTQDDHTDAAVAVIAHSTWQREFSGDPSVVGRTIRVAEFVHVIGVAPDGFIGIDRLWPGSRNPGHLAADVDGRPRAAAHRCRTTAAGTRRGLRRAVEGRRAYPQNSGRRLRWSGGRLATARAGQPQTGRADVDRVWRVRPDSWHFAVIIVMPIPIWCS